MVGKEELKKELDISVVILTYNEELHIRRCLENVNTFARQIFIIDSYSNDETLQIAKEYDKVVVLQNKWENNHAKQFNWGLDHAPISTKWVLRLDADELLTPELIDELRQRLDKLEEGVTGVVFKRRHYFMGKWMKRGIYPVKLLRCFRSGKARCESKLMDEHIQLLEGDLIEFEHDFMDFNLNNVSWFCQKHINYAVREAAELLDIEYDLTGRTSDESHKKIVGQAVLKRTLKHKYVKQPLFWRAFAYFIYRYFCKGAFLDGKVGFIWTFLQGWWYRTLVDVKIYEIKQRCGSDKKLIRDFLKKEYNIEL